MCVGYLKWWDPLPGGFVEDAVDHPQHPDWGSDGSKWVHKLPPRGRIKITKNTIIEYHHMSLKLTSQNGEPLGYHHTDYQRGLPKKATEVIVGIG